MTNINGKWPRLALAEAHARLTAPGAPFETTEILVEGRPMRVWKHGPATAAEAFAAARGFGPREFLVLGEERITYDAFCRAVLKLAAELNARGLKKGDRVALAMRNVPEWPVVFMAGLLAGAIMVPLNGWWTGPELAFGIADCQARFLFADGEQWTRLAAPPPCVEQVFVTRGGGAPAPARALEDVIGTPGHWTALAQTPAPVIALSPEDDATIFYTSGTTGAPRGVLGSHRALTTNIMAAPFLLARNALRRGDDLPDFSRLPPRIALVAVPFFHVVGSLSVMLPSLAAGGKLVLMHKFDAGQGLELIEREKVTMAGGVPAIMLALLDHPRRAEYDLSSLTLATYGGAPPPPDLAARIVAAFPGAAPGHGWGMTETSATCTSHSGADYLARPLSCGPVLPVGDLKVLVDGRSARPGEVGALWACGPNVVKGYWRRPEASAANFQDGWVKTGDMAFLDEEGFLTIVDRAADMVIRGGAKIYCSEVENILMRHPLVVDAALLGLAHPRLGEVPAALVHARGPVSADELRAFAARHLAGFKVPEHILVLSQALPRNAGGKLARRALAKRYGGVFTAKADGA